MNEYEFAEAFSALMTAGLSAMGLYFTAVTGYLIVAYLVGDKLTRSQLAIISSLFVVFATVMIFAGFSMMERGITMEAKIEGGRDLLDYASYLILVAGIVGIFASLKFMFDVRKESRR